MAEHTVPSKPQVQVTGSGFPSLEVPTVYADGIANIAPSPQVVKFYLFRTDPDTGGQNVYKNQVVLQVAMHMQGFVAACVFFEKTLKQFVESNYITQEQVDDMRRMFGPLGKTT
jgi:hypothetical protein